MNLNPHNLQLDQTVLFEGKEAILKEFIDPLVCEIEIDKPTCYTQPKDNFMNKIYSLIGFPLDIEIKYDTYRGVVQCSIYNLKPLTPVS